jgi:hypothetical protein
MLDTRQLPVVGEEGISWLSRVLCLNWEWHGPGGDQTYLRFNLRFVPMTFQIDTSRHVFAVMKPCA